MSDINCPECGVSQEINHDDGHGCAEGVDHYQDCIACGNPFKFTTSISYSYDVFCSGKHKMEQSPVMRHADLWSCVNCDYYEITRDA